MDANIPNIPTHRRNQILLKLRSIHRGSRTEMLSAAATIVDQIADRLKAETYKAIESQIMFFQELLDEVRFSTYFAAQDVAPKIIRARIDQLYAQLRVTY